jgi:hypothetical protein
VAVTNGEIEHERFTEIHSREDHPRQRDPELLSELYRGSYTVIIMFLATAYFNKTRVYLPLRERARKKDNHQ